MGIIFDGRAFAKEKEEKLKVAVKGLGRTPKLVSILVGKDKASILYTNLKKKAADGIGVKFLIEKFPENADFNEIVNLIEKFNKDDKVDGIMVQLPLPASLSKYRAKILNAIDPKKDVDGLVRNSKFVPATARAVKEILEYATKDMPYFGKKASVVGAKGTVGKGIVKVLEGMGYKVTECDKDTRDLYAKLTNANLVISATGAAGLIKGEVIREGAIAIDVGAPEGDFERGVYERAGFVTPVPGGVGPVTIVCLLENLVEAVYN